MRGHVDISEQTIEINGDRYSVAVCVLAARKLKPFNLEMRGAFKNYAAPNSDDLLDFVEHYKRVESADLSFPIILCPKGVIIDGRHRLIKSILQEAKTIKAVQLENMPAPLVECDE